MLAILAAGCAGSGGNMYKLGCLIDRRRSLRGRIASTVRKCSYPVPDSVMLPMPWEAKDQSGQSCTAFACACAMRYMLGHNPSEIDMYHIGRKRAGRFPQDAGTYICELLAAASELGYLLEDESPWVEGNQNVPRDVNQRMKAIRRAGGFTFSAIDDSDIKSVVAAGAPVVIGIEVDEEFCSASDMTPAELGGNIVGGHAMVIRGYDPEGVVVRNSWGPGWGVDGDGKISWGALRRGWLVDLLVVGKSS